MKGHSYLLFCLSFLVYSCSGPAGDLIPPLPTDQVDEDALFLALSPLLYTNPTNPQATAQNEIINYALDNKLDVRPTGSGLFSWVIDKGEGQAINSNSELRAHYVGRLLDGTVFDYSKPGDPLAFTINQMIFGWKEGLKQVGKGGHLVLLIPPAMAYGEEGITAPNGRVIVPPNASLRFDIKVLGDNGEGQ